MLRAEDACSDAMTESTWNPTTSAKTSLAACPSKMRPDINRGTPRARSSIEVYLGEAGFVWFILHVGSFGVGWVQKSTAIDHEPRMNLVIDAGKTVIHKNCQSPIRAVRRHHNHVSKQCHGEGEVRG